ncbi:CobW family GTP-binding protein [Ensifer soli]|uniref:CobW family GTP-binding protein n=1 Tax=Ciceribacter sp. sgz301302 TaxID=3342379 RepID=UPI0035B78F51
MTPSFASVPVSILTGFLGAGKTTLLNHVLRDEALADTAVIINEFGDVSIDHLLVETSGDGVIELSDGCLCCTVRGELVDTLADLMDRMQTGRIRPLRRVIIETTGLADPGPVMQSVIGNPVLSQNYRLDGIVTVVDAVNGVATLKAHEEAVRQVAVADLIVLSKQTLAHADERDGVLARIAAINPRVRIVDGDAEEARKAGLFDCGLLDPAGRGADIARWLGTGHAHDHEHEHDAHCGHDHHAHHHHHHGADLRSFSIVHDTPIDPLALRMFVDLLRSAHGESILRMKAVACIAGSEGRPLVLHGVQSVFHPPERLAAWPDPEDRRTRMVLITKNLPETFVRDLFDAFTGRPSIDRPDAAALADNPLAIPGMRIGV